MMQSKWQNRNVCYYDKIASTNEQAKYDAVNGAESGTLIVADEQTSGKGRRGRTWDSPSGTNIYFSLLLKPEFLPEKASMLTLVMALAVAKGITRFFPQILHAPLPCIKWPNDIVINGKKVCGILTEMHVQNNQIQYVVIGVGINVHKQDFAPELVDKATSLEAEWGQRISREELLADILDAFDAYYAVFERQGDLSGLCDIYNGMLVNREREVCILDPRGEYRGIATGITDTGELCVRLADGSITQVYSGEVSVRGIYGYV